MWMNTIDAIFSGPEDSGLRTWDPGSELEYTVHVLRKQVACPGTIEEIGTRA